MSDETELRLNRIETKLDKLSEAMTTMARIDERLSHNQETHGRMWNVIEKISIRVDQLEHDSGSNTFITRRVERFTWVMITAVIAAGAAWLSGVSH